MNRLTKSTTWNVDILPDQALRGRLIISHIHRHDVLRSRHIVAFCSVFFCILRDFYHSMEVDDGHDQENVEENDEKESPNLIHGASSLDVGGGVHVDGPDESHDGSAEAEAEHDVEHQPGEEAEQEVPGDAHHHQQVAHQLTHQPGHQQVQWARAWGNKEKEIISRVSDLD